MTNSIVPKDLKDFSNMPITLDIGPFCVTDGKYIHEISGKDGPDLYPIPLTDEEINVLSQNPANNLIFLSRLKSSVAKCGKPAPKEGWTLVIPSDYSLAPPFCRECLPYAGKDLRDTA